MSSRCRVLGISVSGYYDWHKREPSAHEREDGELAKRIHHIFAANPGVYGSPGVHGELVAQGLRCCKERTARLMGEMELVAKRKRSIPGGRKRRRDAQLGPNGLGRDFTAGAPKSKWVSDTTSVWTAEGWL